MQSLVGSAIAQYRIVAPLGEGGMGTVYRAVDTHLERDVALKLIRVDVVRDPQALGRFEREAKSLAQLAHPNIVKVFDYGQHAGMPYLVLDYVEGGTLKDVVRPMHASTAAQLLAPIARALAYAHTQGIMHCDVKPTNILLTTGGQPLLADFGLAQMIGPEFAAGLERSNAMLGTPEYMAPEQWHGKAEPASDCYALGAILYELVTGHTPFAAATPAAVLIKQATEPLPRPRTIVATIPELAEQILFTAMDKDPTKRYTSLAEFASALDALAAGERVGVSGTHLYPTGDVSGTHRYPTGDVSGTHRYPAGDVSGTHRYPAGDVSGTHRYPGVQSPTAPVPTVPTRHLRRWAWVLGALAVIAVVGLGATLRRGIAPTATNQPSQAQASAPVGTSTSPMPTRAAVTVATTGAPTATQGAARPTVGVPGTSSVGGRLPDDLAVIDASNVSHLALLDVLSVRGTLIGWSPDGSLMAVYDKTRLTLLNARTFVEQRTISVTGWALSFSPDWSLVAIATTNHVEIWDVADARSLKALRGHSDDVLSLAFAPDGKLLATGSKDRTIRIWDVATGTELHRLDEYGGEVNSLIFTPDGQTLASASKDGSVRLWEVSSGKELRTLTGRGSPKLHLTLSPDGTALFAAAGGSLVDTALWRWDLADGTAQTLLQYGSRELTCVAMVPDGKILAICPVGMLIRLIDPASGRDLGLLPFAVEQLSFSPDSKVLAISGENQIQLWGVSSAQTQDLAVLTPDNVIELQSLGALGPGFSRVDANPPTPQRIMNGVMLSAGGTRIALPQGETSQSNAVISSYDLATGTIVMSETVSAGSFGSPVPMVASANGRWLAATRSHLQPGESESQSFISLWDADSLKELHSFPSEDGAWISVALSPDGTLIAGSTQSEIRIWEIGSGQLRQTLVGPGVGLAFSPDSAQLASGSKTEVTLWNIASGQKLRAMQGAGLALVFSPDGTALASAGEADKAGWGVHLWDVANGEERHYLLLERTVSVVEGGGLAFSPDGSVLAGGSGGQIVLWDTASGERLWAMRAHAFAIDPVFLAFTPDGKQLVSVANDGVVRRWGVYRTL